MFKGIAAVGCATRPSLLCSAPNYRLLIETIGDWWSGSETVPTPETLTTTIWAAYRA